MPTNDPLTDHLAAALDAAEPAPLCVAFSGGPDSTALLHALSRLDAARVHGLRALHVDHGLHADSATWAARCAHRAQALDVPLAVVRVEVSASAGGLEGAAREARYAAAEAHLEPGERLVVAHHRDDQAETFLLRALRGSGPDGLAGMRPLRPLGRGWLWRPLLDVPREVLIDHVVRHGLPVVEDPANTDLRHDRSRLRSAVMPLLRARWPDAAASLARSATLCAEAAGLLAREDAGALAQVQGLDPATLDVPGLLRLPPARRARVVRHWVAACGLPPLPASGSAAVEALLTVRRDAQAQFRWCGAAITRWRTLLHAAPLRDALPAGLDLAWDGASPLPLPGGGLLLLEAVAGAAPAHAPAAAFRVRARRGGERMRLPGRAHSHALKHLLQDAAVPPWERARLPLLFADDGELLAAGDLLVSARLQAWLEVRGQRLVWQT
ncbi:tRNA lysidine(34) synthetase TilS [Coralloluteibacterium thermophilus]|uniref:tRNA(Ile)-lysidine synthase n=1 Tax=Coralloluteibacterium thermophilum TaxID=2707049 RepID=A0ABV9NJM9_9GAMM